MNNRAETAPLKVLCTNGLKSVLLETGEDLSNSTGIRFSADYGATRKFADLIAEGDSPDVAILTDEAIDALIGRGALAPGRSDVARSYIGVSVRSGTPRPDIGTAPAFIAALRAARAISRSRQGVSGLHLMSVLEKMGLAEELSPKIKIYDGYAGQACAEGETDIAIQQISEMMPVPGLDIVGPLPDELQKVTMFSAGFGAGSSRRADAEKFVGFLTRPDQADALRRHGLEPA